MIGAGIGAAIGWWGGFALGGISGAAGGTLVAPGVGTIGGGFGGATSGSIGGAALGGMLGALLGDVISNLPWGNGEVPTRLIDPFPLWCAAEHTNDRPSTKDKHEKGKARKRRDRGGEKGDDRRRPPRTRPDGWKGPWPPKDDRPWY